MIGIPTPTCDPSLNTADDTCTGLPVGLGGFDFDGFDFDGTDALGPLAPAVGPLVTVLVTTGPGLVLLLHAATTRTRATAVAVDDDARRSRVANGELITWPP
jgi:hypothetical protein